MRTLSRSRRGAIALAVLVVVTLGALGTWNYAQDYSLHRGFAPVARVGAGSSGRAVQVSFFSRALHRRADYIAYLPAGYTPTRHYPVLYLLHGMPGHPAEFLTVAGMGARLDNLVRLHEARPMILVFPDGRIGGRNFSDSEWANTPTGHYESYVLEVIHNVDARFSALNRRQDRVIGGFSAGAYGALNIALQHLSQFGAVQVWSGYFLQTHSGVFSHASRATLAANSPFDEVTRVASRIRAQGLRVVMYVGRTDPDRSRMAAMAARLAAAGARVSDAVYPGGHDWRLWVSRADLMLRLASRAVGSPPSPVPAGTVAAVAPLPGAVSAPAPASRTIHRRPPLPVLAALVLAVLAGAFINLGFVVQQRAAHRHADAGRPLLASLRDRTWLAGQLVGWLGWLGAIVAVALAPLTLVQAFAAGSLALSTPLAARIFGARVSREQLIAVGAVALSLTLLAIGDGATHHTHRVTAGVLIGASLVGATLAAALHRVGRRGMRAVAGGVCYGIADAAIKADAIGLHGHGASALASGWTLLAAAATLGGFISFQAALRRDEAVTAIALMNAFTTVVAVVLGLSAFGERLGSGPGTVGLHLGAMAIVLACVWPLSRGQEALAGDPHVAEPARGLTVGEGAHRRGWIRAGTAGLSGGLMVLIAAVVGTGLLYSLHARQALGAGPRLPDALSLLMLAGHAGQPALRVIVAFGLAGVALGVSLSALRPATRIVLVALVGPAALLLTSDASFALAENLRFAPVLLHRTPGLGPWIEAGLLVAGCAAAQAVRSLAVRRQAGTTAGLPRPRAGLARDGVTS